MNKRSKSWAIVMKRVGKPALDWELMEGPSESVHYRVKDVI